MVRSIKLKFSRGSGMAIVMFSVVIMLYMAVTTVQILNSKVMFQEYNRLRNTVEASVAGSVIHVSMTDDNQVELSKGYIINEDAPPSPGDPNILATGNINNYYALDHQLANKYTLELIKKSMNISDVDIKSTDKVKILMIVIEPYYDAATYKREYKIYYYGNGIENGHDYSIETLGTDLVTDGNRFDFVEDKINFFINHSSATDNYRSAKRTYDIRINGEKDYINKLTNHQYYLVLVNDFPLKTLLANNSSDVDNFTPICSMQASQSSRGDD